MRSPTRALVTGTRTPERLAVGVADASAGVAAHAGGRGNSRRHTFLRRAADGPRSRPGRPSRSRRPQPEAGIGRRKESRRRRAGVLPAGFCGVLPRAVAAPCTARGPPRSGLVRARVPIRVPPVLYTPGASCPARAASCRPSPRPAPPGVPEHPQLERDSPGRCSARSRRVPGSRSRRRCGSREPRRDCGDAPCRFRRPPKPPAPAGRGTAGSREHAAARPARAPVRLAKTRSDQSTAVVAVRPNAVPAPSARSARPQGSALHSSAAREETVAFGSRASFGCAPQSRCPSSTLPPLARIK